MKIYILIFLVLALNFKNLLSQNDLPAEKIYELVNSSVVVVFAYDTLGNQYQGSGIILNDEGYVVTNYHVCKDADRYEISHYSKEFKYVEIYKEDSDKDIIIFKVADISLPPIKLGSSTSLKPGQRIYAVGSPEGYENSISEGIVSGVRKDPNGNNLIQMTTPITDGSSGGAVVNSKGELIGMSMSGQHEGSIYFAVPVEDIITLIETTIVSKEEQDEISYFENSVNYLSAGNDALSRQNYEEAVYYFSKYLEKNPDDIETHYNRGFARLKLKKYELAVNDLSKAIGYGTDKFEMYFYRANAYYYMGDFANAVKDYTNAIDLAPNLAELYYNRGYSNFKLKLYNAAINDWNSAIKFRPEYETELNPLIISIQGKK